jgi:hypothetical protein
LLVKEGEGTALGDIDQDGDLDIVYGASWLETPARLSDSSWTRRVLDEAWPSITKVRVADMNNDQRLDVILSVSEARGQVVWWEAPLEVQIEAWQKHVIESEELELAHSLQIADVNRDNRLDVITAEMHTSQQKRIIIYFNSEGKWLRQIVAASGSHNLRVADLGGDHDIDLIGKNYAGPGNVVELWQNQL